MHPGIGVKLFRLIMRIIAGRAGGIHLKVPAMVARPTADRVREALFSMLGDLVQEAGCWISLQVPVLWAWSA